MPDTHIGGLENSHFHQLADDIRGATMYDKAGRPLGKVEDVLFDHTTGYIRYLVTGAWGWLTSRRFLVPVDWVEPARPGVQGFACDLIEDKIQQFPEYREAVVASEFTWTEYKSALRAVLAQEIRERKHSVLEFTNGVGSKVTGSERLRDFEKELIRNLDLITGECEICRRHQREKAA